MAPEFSSNTGRAQEILRQYNELDVEEAYDEAVFAVHPGFCTNDESYTRIEGLDATDYRDYSLEFHRGLQEDIEQGIPVNVVYRNGRSDEATLYLDEKKDEVENFVESSYGSGFVTNERGGRQLAQALSQIEDGGQLQINGEINGLCVGQFEDLVSEVERGLEKDLNISLGKVFPERPVDRTQGHLHWEDDVPVYIQAMDQKSLY